MTDYGCLMCGRPAHLYVGMCDRCFALFKARTEATVRSGKSTLEKAKERMSIIDSRIMAEENPL
jgi:hypothetical protein